LAGKLDATLFEALYVSFGFQDYVIFHSTFLFSHLKTAVLHSSFIILRLPFVAFQASADTLIELVC
jgi:hypothetical protein